ncbi:MAG: cysteine methyltransferase [Parcubacteria group bacterium GW2011_GWE2_39_37]|uniref:methylated-DNA--[protein]-cysteine S-methyltransferase n=1 Tax=Candidatus Falkowbacteria bacterium GW2011_GWF2_39_8 TaxID=1618642 RepID=A0A0G0PZY0_9BACT|nr:MAG: cysteine methyltransferase [Parcubacteria group bacterium GW2011_GWE2_39_37]KKR33629.1 MAG: cysteine methyltransferase [Candidatus Falkowbacteria bacterium GW2011_GWF2_39_8]
MLTQFEKEVLKNIAKVPLGKVTTYKDLACAIGRPRSARAVGNALNKNPDAPTVPCHRVVKSDGRLGGYAWGVKKKIGLLKDEGVLIKNGRVVDFENRLYIFKK